MKKIVAVFLAVCMIELLTLPAYALDLENNKYILASEYKSADSEVQHLAWPCGERPERFALRGAETQPQRQPRFADLRRACQQVQSLGQQIVHHEGDRFVSGALQRVRVNGLQSVHKKYSFPVCQCGILIL